MKKKLAEYLLSIKAVKLNPEFFFTWASGIKSPIYCDNRLTLSYPKIRNHIKNMFVNYIKKNFSGVEAIAGVATGAIAHGILVAQEMNLPFVYVRPKAKKHGKKNKIEGKLSENSKVVVIEDLISTGGSSINAINSLKNQNAEILGLIAIFSYGFNLSKENFAKTNCKFSTLLSYDELIKTAVEKNYIKQNDLKILKDWSKNFKK